MFVFLTYWMDSNNYRLVSCIITLTIILGIMMSFFSAFPGSTNKTPHISNCKAKYFAIFFNCFNCSSYDLLGLPYSGNLIYIGLCDRDEHPQQEVWKTTSNMGDKGVILHSFCGPSKSYQFYSGELLTKISWRKHEKFTYLFSALHLEEGKFSPETARWTIRN